ncbi:MAG: N-acetyltransferase [Alphaproteobacteria bacterium]|nr:N-acetyltransferase [Alphaproteobacteria bacterium]
MFAEATLDDCRKIAHLAAKTFTDAFGHLYHPENLDQHLQKKFSHDFFADALQAGSTILTVHDDDRLIGYGKVGHVSLPVKRPIPKGAQEIHRVYIDKEFQGRGLGKALMLHMLSLPRVATSPMVYLGVWEENLKAQMLYKQYGFEAVGRYLYQVGDQHDREIIMARKR